MAAAYVGVCFKCVFTYGRLFLASYFGTTNIVLFLGFFGQKWLLKDIIYDLLLLYDNCSAMGWSNKYTYRESKTYLGKCGEYTMTKMNILG